MGCKKMLIIHFSLRILTISLLKFCSAKSRAVSPFVSALSRSTPWFLRNLTISTLPVAAACIKGVHPVVPSIPGVPNMYKLNK